MRVGRPLRIVALLACALGCGAVRAQNTFILEPGITPGFTAVEQGGYEMPTLTDYTGSPTGKRVYVYAHGAFEFPIVCETPGLYKVSVTAFVPNDLAVLGFETRRASASGDPYATRYHSPDTETLPKTGEGSWVDFTDMSDNNISPILLPLNAGPNVLRVQNVSGLHTPANFYPTDVSAANNRPSVQGSNSSFSISIARITLERVSSLPVYGTVTGKVTGDKPAGTPVDRAIVTANPPDLSTVELNNWWKSGYWTNTRTDGTYTLQAPVGPQEIKAGRASSYNVEGSTPIAVTVSAGTPASANPTLVSQFHDDGTGHPTIAVQNEYYDTHEGGIGFYAWDVHENTLGILGRWGSAAGLSATYIVDAPQTGLYRAAAAYNWGGGDNRTRVTTNLGATSEVDLPNSGWGLVLKEFPDLLYLTAGRNVITETVVSGDVGWDSLHLTLTDEVATVGTLQGTVVDSVSGQPLPGATISFGAKSQSTDANGRYQILLDPGTYAMSVSAPFMDAPVSGSATVVQGQTTTKDFSIAIRPHLDLSSANGFEWKALLNTGGAADYSAAVADESAFQVFPVPGSWADADAPEQIYGWYRLHFTVPEGFTTGLPNRLALLHVYIRNYLSISEVDQVFINGTAIGQTGRFPDPPLGVQPADHMQPRDETGLYNMPPGLMLNSEEERLYYFPTSLLKAGDNVLAVRAYNNGSNGWIARPGGIVGLPVLEIAGPTGTVSGIVTAAGSPVPGVRVTALDGSAMASDWTLTGADGRYTLPHAAAGTLVVAAAKPGYNAVSIPAGALANGQNRTLDIVLTAVPGGAAPTYDDFSSANWTERWLAQSIDGANGSDPTLAPIVTIPGFDPNTMTTIPGSVTIENTQTGGPGGNAIGRWGAIISKARISRWASVTAGKLIGVKDGTEVNVFLLGSNDPDTTKLNWRHMVGFDIRPTMGGLLGVETGGQPRLLWWIRNSDSFADHTSMGGVPGSTASMLDITPTKPITFAFTRTGSVWDLYLNNEQVWGGNLPGPTIGDHRISTSTWTAPSGQTWDYFQAGPLAGVVPPGDLNRNGQVDIDDARLALRMASGLQAASAEDVTLGNVAGDATISLTDALRLLQAANGRPL